MLRQISFAAALIALALPAHAAGDKLVIQLKTGNVVIKLRPDLAPKHVERVVALAKKGFYDNVKFHRVLDGFMAQTGDPTGTGTGGSDLPDLKAEFTKEPYKRGTVGAARTADPDTANSQFFICFNDTGCSGLTGKYTVWGEVVEGMDNVDKITRVEPGARSLEEPDVMKKVTVQ